MREWLGDNGWLVWFGLAAVLGVTELALLDFTLLMLAAGALAGGLVGLILPSALWLQILVAIVTSAGMLVVIRPWLSRKVHHQGELKTGTAHVIGRSGVVVKEVTPDGGGSIRLGGELWTARPFDGNSTIQPGARVEVMEIDGATAVVYPVGEPLNPNPELGG